MQGGARALLWWRKSPSAAVGAATWCIAPASSAPSSLRKRSRASDTSCDSAESPAKMFHSCGRTRRASPSWWDSSSS